MFSGQTRNFPEVFPWVRCSALGLYTVRFTVTAVWLTVEYGTVEPSTVRWASFWDYRRLRDGYIAAVDGGKRWTEYIYSVLKIYAGSARTTRTWLFTSISTQIVRLGLARRRKIVSQPPEKMCSTATVEPALCQKKENFNDHVFTHQEYILEVLIKLVDCWPIFSGISSCEKLLRGSQGRWHM